MGQFSGEVELTPLDIGDGRMWRVDVPFSYTASNGDIVFVPEKSITDLASIPRPLWIFYPPEGLYTDAAVVHDQAYTEQKFSRLRCDQILLEAMKDLHVTWGTRHIIYWGVRIGGWISWSKYKKKL